MPDTRVRPTSILNSPASISSNAHLAPTYLVEKWIGQVKRQIKDQFVNLNISQITSITASISVTYS